MSIFMRQLADQLCPPEPYGWIIDKDHLYDPDSPESASNRNDAGFMGPRDIPAEIERTLKSGGGRPFRLYDDDGELHFSGRIFTPKQPEGGCEEDFRPLEEFGTGSGASEIHYYSDSEGKWVPL